MNNSWRAFFSWITLALFLGCIPVLAAVTPNAGALWLPYLLQQDGVLPTYGTSIAVDPQGGIHAAYSIYAGANQGFRPAIYAYCPSSFTERTNWTLVPLGENVFDARIALDPQGRPRMMLFGPAGDPENPKRMQYQYAQCNVGWTNSANWSLTTIATPVETTATREDDNNRYFAISPQGTVAFVHTEKVSYYEEYPVYRSCTGDPTNPADWTATTLFHSYIDQPSLAFSPDGHPRLAFGLFQNSDLYLAYAQCDTDPTDASQWSGVVLTKIHGSATYSMQADAAGRPRIAFASGSYAAAPFADHQLYYLWCTEGSIADPANWFYSNPDIPTASGGVDLALDPAGRPRVSYQAWTGLGFAWCNGKAESDTAVWQRRTVESDSALAANFEVLPINKCSQSSWSNGQRSWIALDRSGNPRIGYDAEHAWSGVYVDRPWESCSFKDVTITRFAFFNLSPSLSIQTVGDQVKISFENGTLESAPSINGPWSTATGANSPLLVPMAKPQEFYRLRQ